MFDQIGGLDAKGDRLGGIWLILEEIDDRHSNKEVSQASLIFPLTWSLSKQVLQPFARVIHLAHRFGILFLSEQDLPQFVMAMRQVPTIARPGGLSLSNLLSHLKGLGHGFPGLR